MIDTVWINAWIISSVLSTGVLALARRSGLTRGESVLLGFASFPAPVTYVLGGQNSLVYPIDFAIPIAILLALSTFHRVTVRVKAAAALIVVSAGVIPLLIAMSISGDRMDILYNAVNTYRLVGAMALLVHLSAVHRTRNIDGSWWRLTFSWIAVVLVAAMVLQGYAGINTDVLGSFPRNNIAEIPDAASVRFLVLGLFRGSLGILGLLGICAFLAGEAERSGRWFFSLAGAFCGFAVIVLTGSKTSLVAAVLVVASRLSIWRRFWSVANAGSIIFILVSVFLLVGRGNTLEYIPEGLTKFVSSFGSERDTLDVRMDVWGACIHDVGVNPTIAVGFPLRDTIPMPGTNAEKFNLSPYSPLTYQNEYLSVFMLGGLWSAIAYLAGLCLLGKSLFRSNSLSIGKTFPVLVFAGGLIEAATIAHLQPGMACVCPVFLFAAIYGVAARPRPLAICRGQSRCD